MHELKLFIRAVFTHWLTLMSGCLLIVLVGIFEHVTAASVPWAAYAVLVGMLAVAACFLAWRDKQRELEHVRQDKIAEIDRLNFELAAERDTVKREFQTLRSRLLASSFAHVITQELGSIKEFMFRYPDILERREVRKFYVEWIEPHEIHLQYGAELGLTSAQYTQMKKDLAELRL